MRMTGEMGAFDMRSSVPTAIFRARHAARDLLSLVPFELLESHEDRLCCSIISQSLWR